MRRRFIAFLMAAFPLVLWSAFAIFNQRSGLHETVGHILKESFYRVRAGIDGAYLSVNESRIERSKNLVRALSEVQGDERKVRQLQNGSISKNHSPGRSQPRTLRPPSTSNPGRSIQSVDPSVENNFAMLRDDGMGSTDHEENVANPRGSTILLPENPPPPPRHLFRVLLIGVDSRLGRSDARADALHLISVDMDSGRVEIMAIPRGTPASLGYTDGSANIIAHVLPARGRSALLSTVSRVTKSGPISFYIELGFSQAIGILELIGFNDPASKLRFLRRRKGLQYGDRERSYAQALFLKRTLLKSFDLLTGASGDLLVRAGLGIVKTNVTFDICHGLIYALEEKGFADADADVTVRVHSPYERRLIAKKEEIDVRAQHHGNQRGMRTKTAARVLRKLLKSCGSGPEISSSVRRRLERVIEQHGWLQIRDPVERGIIRDSLVNSLLAHYEHRRENESAALLRENIAHEDTLFQNAVLFLQRRKGVSAPE